jgi:hypothetical protein
VCSAESDPERIAAKRHSTIPPGEQFDQAVGAEGDERDRGGDQPRRERDAGLDAVPGEADPDEPAGAIDEARARRVVDRGARTSSW